MDYSSFYRTGTGESMSDASENGASSAHSPRSKADMGSRYLEARGNYLTHENLVAINLTPLGPIYSPSVCR